MDFSGMIQTWINVITRPGEEVFEQERQNPNANITTALIWIVIAAVIAAVLSAISAGIRAVFQLGTGYEQFLNELDPAMAEQLAPMIGAGAGIGLAAVGSAFCMTLILAPIGFLISSLIYFAVAKLLGGEGTFEEQTYLLATFTAPLTIISGVINLVPVLGACVSLFVYIYQLVLSYFALKVAHNFTTGQAVAAVLIPIVVIILLVVCCVGVIVFAVAGSLSGEF